MGIADRVRELAKRHNQTIAGVERELGFSQGSIRNWNNAAPAADKLYKVAKLFDVSMEYILIGEAAQDSATGTNGISADGLRMGKLWDGLDERGKTIVMAKIYERQEVMRASAEDAAPDEGLLQKEA